MNRSTPDAEAPGEMLPRFTGAPDATATVPDPPITVIAEMELMVALAAVPRPAFSKLSVTLRVPATVPSDRKPTDEVRRGVSVA